MAKLSKLSQQLRKAFDGELPGVHLDEDIILWMSSMLDNDDVTDDELADEWSPHVAPMWTAGDDEAPGELCRAVLRRFRGSMNGDDATAALTRQLSREFSRGSNSNGSRSDGGAVLARAASSVADSSAPAQVQWLHEWLEALHLTHYESLATVWCTGTGVTSVEALVENWEEFSMALRLKPLEARRVCKSSLAAGASGSFTPTGLACGGGPTPALGAHAAASVAAKAGGGGVAHGPNRGCDGAATSGDKPMKKPAQGESPAAPSRGPAHALSMASTALSVESRPSMPPLASVPDGPEAEPPAETFGSAANTYTIGARLGKGVTATVYRCHRAREDSRRTDQVFAVKVIPLSKLRLQPNFTRILEKLHRESAILFSMRHSHIVSLYEVIETHEKLFLVMEFVEGGELLEELNRGALPENEVRYIFLQLLLGLRYIHSKGVVHRDLKLENVLVDRRVSRQGLLQVKISDFGHSKLVNDGYSTALTHGVGTPQYWAPEVDAKGPSPQGYDERVDLWSLGVMLHVMLAGKYPSQPLQFRDDSLLSSDAQDLIRGLIQIKPDFRLTLDECLRHPWVMTASGPLSQIVLMCEDLERRRRREQERRMVLPRDPLDVRKLRRDLHLLMLSSKLPVTLRHKEVVISFAPDASAHSKEVAKSELVKVLGRHFPGASFADSQEVALAPVVEEASLADSAFRGPSADDLARHDAELRAAMEAFPENIEGAVGETAPVPRRAAVRQPLRVSGGTLEFQIEFPAGYPTRSTLLVAALSLKGGPPYEDQRAEDLETRLHEQIRFQLRSARQALGATSCPAASSSFVAASVVATADAADGSPAGSTAHNGNSGISKGFASSPLVALVSWLRDEVLPSLDADICRSAGGCSEVGDAASSIAAPSDVGEGGAHTVQCARICLVTHLHDEKLDARFLRGEGKKTSFFAHIKNTFPEVSGLLSFGKPAVLVGEGPIKTVEKLRQEVNKCPWWREVDQKDFKILKIGDVHKWRAFNGFAKVKTEDLQEVFTQVGLAELYEPAVAGTVMDPQRPSLGVQPKRKLKGKVK